MPPPCGSSSEPAPSISFGSSTSKQYIQHVSWRRTTGVIPGAVDAAMVYLYYRGGGGGDGDGDGDGDGNGQYPTVPTSPVSSFAVSAGQLGTDTSLLVLMLRTLLCPAGSTESIGVSRIVWRAGVQ